MDESLSRELEKDIVACFIKNSSYFPKYEAVEPKHFSSQFERDVFDLFKAEVSNLNGKDFSVASFILKVKSARIPNSYNTDVEVFLKHAIEFSPNPNELDSLISSLLLNYKAREINQALGQGKEWLSKPQSKRTHKSIAHMSDRLSAHLVSINGLGQDDKIKNLADGLEAIEDRMLNPQPIAGFKSSLNLYHERFGTFRPKEYHVFHANQGVGKSSLLMQLALEFVDSHPENQCLYLDRELAFEHQIIRTTMSNTGIHHEDIESGLYESDEHRETVSKYLANMREKQSLKRLAFVEVKDFTIEEIVNLARTWRFSQDRSRPATIVYDYLNVGKKGSREDSSWLDLSDQISELKILCKEMNMVLLTAMQTNRSGDARNTNNNSGTSNSIGASFKAVEDSNHSMFLLQKTDEEIAADERITLEAVRERWSELHEQGNHEVFLHGSHKIVPHKNRWPGKNMINMHSELIKEDHEGNAVKTQYYINICLCRGKVIEKGDVFTVINYQRRNPTPTTTSSNSPNRNTSEDNVSNQESSTNQEQNEDSQEELF